MTIEMFTPDGRYVVGARQVEHEDHVLALWGRDGEALWLDTGARFVREPTISVDADGLKVAYVASIDDTRLVLLQTISLDGTRFPR